MLKNVLSLKNIIWFCAIGLATFSGYYSVYGISKLFAGGSFSIIGMAAMLELAKLVVVAFLHNYHSSLKFAFKVYLTLSALVLMTITSIGVYGYLTNSYQETAKVVNTTQNEITLLDQRRKLFESQKQQIDHSITQKTDRVAQYDKIRISQENTYSKLLDGKRGTKGLQQNIKGIDQTTNQLNTEITGLSTKSMALTDSINAIDQKKLELTNSTFSSEMGPLLYLSNITGQPMDQIVNWFILFLVVVFDPLAVSLVIAANHISKVSKGESHPAISGINGDFPEGRNDHPSVPTDGLSEPPDEWIDEVVDDEPITETTVDVVPDVEEKNDLEIQKEVPILDPDQDLDQEDLDLLVDQIDPKDQDELDILVNEEELVKALTEEPVVEEEIVHTPVTFEQQQNFYEETNHRVNRASGGI